MKSRSYSNFALIRLYIDVCFVFQRFVYYIFGVMPVYMPSFQKRAPDFIIIVFWASVCLSVKGNLECVLESMVQGLKLLVGVIGPPSNPTKYVLSAIIIILLHQNIADVTNITDPALEQFTSLLELDRCHRMCKIQLSIRTAEVVSYGREFIFSRQTDMVKPNMTLEMTLDSFHASVL